MTTAWVNYHNAAPGRDFIFYEPAYSVQAIPTLRDVDNRLRLMKNNISAPQEIDKEAYDGVGPATTLDFAAIESSMRQIAQQQGIDFDALIQEASHHFQNPAITPWMSNLTDSDIKLLADDDDQALSE